jgi:hypothetical protein
VTEITTIANRVNVGTTFYVVLPGMSMGEQGRD